MNNPTVPGAELDEYTKRKVRITKHADVARIIIVPVQCILINTAAAPDCNMDKVCWTMEQYAEYLGDRAFCLLGI